MTIDEAINMFVDMSDTQKAMAVLREDEYSEFLLEEGASHFAQVAEWLRELKVYRKFYSCHDCYNASASFNEYPCNVCIRGREATKNIKDYYEEVNANGDNN